MSRRRLMLWQQARGTEYIYDPASGVYPEDTGEWSFTGGSYWGDRYNTRSLSNNLLNLSLGAYSATQHYFPVSRTANKCELEVHLNVLDVSPDCAACTVMLSDGENLALAAVTQTMLRVGERCKSYSVGVQQSWTDKFNTTFNPVGEPFIFKVTKEADKAFYYLNDELLYTQTQLFSKSILPATESSGFIGSQAEPYTTVRFGYGTCSVSKIIYREL